MSGLSLLTYREVLNWIAFREAVEADLVDPASGEIADDDLLPALLALADERPVAPPPDLIEMKLRWEEDDENSASLSRWYHEARASHDRVVAHALTLVVQGRSSAQLVAAEVRVRLEQRAARAVRFAAALDELVAAVGRGALRGHVVPNAGSYRNRVSPDDRLRRFGELPPGWFELRVVKRLWPSSRAFAHPQQRHAGQRSEQAKFAPALPGNAAPLPTRVCLLGEDPLLDAREAASECGRRLSTFRRDVRAGHLPAAYYVLPRMLRWRRSELRAAVLLSERK